MLDRLTEIRNAEAESHREIYSQNKLFAEGSWLAKPVRTVMEILPLLEGVQKALNILDLGCGVGRNCIPIADTLKNKNCNIDCVDILEFAIDELNKNAAKHNVSDAVNGIISDIGKYSIAKDNYDLIISVSALEHVDSKSTFINKLMEIRDGVAESGIVCLIINTDIQEKDKDSGEVLPVQFEVNMASNELKRVVRDIFTDWQIIKETVVHQRYDIPRKKTTAVLDTNVATFVFKKEKSNFTR